MATSANAAVPQVVGKVFVLYGTVKAVAPDGTVRILAPNSPIYANEQIITGSDGSVSIQFAGPPVTQLDLGRMTEIVVDEDVYAGVAPEVVADAAAEAEKIQEALLAGDEEINLDATAAGGDAGAGGGHSVVIFDLDGNEVTPGSGAETEGIATTDVGTLSGVFVTATAPEAPPYPGVVNLTATEQITEADGQLITYTAMVDNAPLGSNLVLTLSNGASITILVGETTGSTTVTTSQGEDVYVDPESLVVSITGATGGGYTSLDASDTATTEVIDTIDTTTVSLSGPESVNEGESASYTVSVDHPPQTDMTVNVSYSYISAETNDIVTNTTQVTIQAGQSSASFSVGTVDDQIYEGTETFAVSISNPQGGNFEKLVLGNSSVQTDILDNDLPTISISDAEPVQEPINYQGGDEVNGQYEVQPVYATFTVTLSEVSTEIVTVAFNTANGTAIAGGTGVGENDYGQQTGTLTFLPGETSKIIQVQILDDSIAEGSENFYVNLSAPTNATILDPQGMGTIYDEDIPDNAFTLKLFAVSEGEGGLVYSAVNSMTEGGSANYIVLAVDANGNPLADADQPGGTVTVNVGAQGDTALPVDDY
ncbi:MAG: retention module-containing protein, partial [Pseudomonadota bacterium]